MVGDTASHSVGRKPKLEKAKAHRRVKTIRSWEFDHPVSFRSNQSKQAETLIVVLRGEVGVVLFLSEGKLIQTHRLGGKSGRRSFSVPAGTYYSVISLSSEAAVIEAQPSGSNIRPAYLEKAPRSGTPEGRDAWSRWVAYCR